MRGEPAPSSGAGAKRGTGQPFWNRLVSRAM
jgi:hypothetical protein